MWGSRPLPEFMPDDLKERNLWTVSNATYCPENLQLRLDLLTNFFSHLIFIVMLALLFKAWPLAAQDRFFDSNGVQIRYIDQGSGEPVVLIHGLLGNIEWSWGDIGIIANLSKDHRVIAFDVRGHGKSGKPYGADAYGQQMSGRLAAVGPSEDPARTHRGLLERRAHRREAADHES